MGWILNNPTFGRRRSKYGSEKFTVLGITFDSKKEGMHYLRLLDMEKRGEIHNLRRQVPFELLPAIYREEVVHLKTKDKIVKKCVQKSVKYVADFVYEKDGKEVIVDTKGVRTPEYILKKKMMLALLGITITEV